MGIIGLVNILYLLRKEPADYNCLLQSGCFNKEQLKASLDRLKDAGLIRQEWRGKERGFFGITSLGVKVLNQFDNEQHPWQLEQREQNGRMMYPKMRLAVKVGHAGVTIVPKAKFRCRRQRKMEIELLPLKFEYGLLFKSWLKG